MKTIADINNALDALIAEKEATIQQKRNTGNRFKRMELGEDIRLMNVDIKELKHAKALALRV